MIEITSSPSSTASLLDTTSSSTSNDRDRLVGNFDTFLNVLTTQLSNQDPLDPMNTSEFTNQLVQFAGVEQQLAQSETLEKIALKLEQSQSSTAVNLVGKQVATESNWFELRDSFGQFEFTLPEGVRTASLEIRDSRGRIAYTTDLDPTSNVANTVTWDGNTPPVTPGEEAVLNDDGLYQIVINAQGGDQSPLNPTTLGYLGVSDISFKAGTNEAVFGLANGSTVGWEQISGIR
ncbi:MAG: hypothetical protein K0U36_01655 [Alphaproteobacteria bacterium]|nr:hypothetical protein [Alphaproteobacteria bacterium]